MDREPQDIPWCFQCNSDIARLEDHAIGCIWADLGPTHPEIAPMPDEYHEQDRMFAFPKGIRGQLSME